jgi:hypothetical protein
VAHTSTILTMVMIVNYREKEKLDEALKTILQASDEAVENLQEDILRRQAEKVRGEAS